MALRPALSLSVLVLLVLALPGCQPGDQPADGNGGAGASNSGEQDSGGKLTAGGVEPAENDTLLLAYPNDPNTLNAITGSDTMSNAFRRHVYEPLGQADFHDPDRILPALATSWELDEENLEYTIHLRQGVKWHPMKLPNGKRLPQKEFTARDVKFSFDCVLNPHVEAAHIRSYYEDAEAEDASSRYMISVKVVDDYTVKVKWTKPYFLMEEFTLAGIEIIPRHVYSVDENGEPISFDFMSREFGEAFNVHWANKLMCGTGPMRFKEWTRNERLVLERNPDYWGPSFYFSQLMMRCIPNTNTMTQQFLQGELDSCGFPEKDQWLQAADSASVKSGDVSLDKYEYPGYRYIGYNLNRPIFREKAFRWALSHATPVQQIIDSVFHGLAQRVTGPFLPGSSANDPSIEPVAYDLDRAKQLLDEAGWTDSDGDGVRDKIIEGVKTPAFFELIIFSDSRAFKAIAEIYQENCRKIGVKVQITPAKWSLFLDKLNSKEFDAVMLGWGSGWSKSDPRQIWHGDYADEPSSSNHTAYRNPKVDALIDELRTTLDSERQVELYHEIHRLIYEDQPYTFLFSELATGGRNGRIENVHFYRLRPCVDTREWYGNRPRILGQ